MMAAILNSAILNSTISDIAILVFPLKNHSHLPRLVPTICTIKPPLIHSDSIWWWQPSWILPCWIKKTFTHSFLLNLMMAAILNSAMLDSDTLFSSLRFTHKTTLTPLWLWLKLIQSDSNSFILTQLDDGSHLEFFHLEYCHPGFSHHSFFLLKTHLHLPRLVPHHLHKKTFTHSFWLNLMMAAILNSTMLD